MNSENEKNDSQRPHPQHASKSFSQAIQLSSKFYPQVQRVNSLQDGTIDHPTIWSQDPETDAFERDPYDSESQESLRISEKLPDSFDKLPAELANLSEHFIDSLSAKVHRSPPSIDKLSSLFQDFYEIASHHIHTHVSSTSRQSNRQRAMTTSLPSSITSAGGKSKSNIISTESFNRPKSSSGKEILVQQMLTSEEIADKREVRKMLGLKRIALEEAIEKKVCEATYNQIWRHRSTHDEERDEKLRSRTAALSLVGIGLRDLGVDLGVKDNEDSSVIKEKEAEVAEWLSEARTELCAMNDLKYPLGKLQHLKSAHKAIVETLSHFHPSSSADEIMPMLIYTLITSRPEGINIMSNLHFIQRFRNANKIDGEAAYCLTNLEAAIFFVETVDLASLRADEVLSGPPKSRTNTPSPEIFDPLINPLTPSTSVSTTESPCVSPSPQIVKEGLSPARSRHGSQTQSRRLNDLFQPSNSLGAASDAVLSSADQGLESIGNSIGDSYKFLLAKIKGRQDDEIESKNEITTKLTSNIQNTVINSLENDPQLAGNNSHNTQGASLKTTTDSGSKIEDKILNMISGRKTSRDKSSDSSKRVSFAEDSGSGNGKITPTSQNIPTTNPPIVESMRNLGNSLNPINRIAGIGMMRAFTRSTPPATPTITATLAPLSGGPLNSGIPDVTKDFTDLNSDPLLKASNKVDPPIAKFLEIQTPGEIKLHEVIELLQDYKRLAQVLKESGMIKS